MTKRAVVTKIINRYLFVLTSSLVLYLFLNTPIDT